MLLLMNKWRTYKNLYIYVDWCFLGNYNIYFDRFSDYPHTFGNTVKFSQWQIDR